MPSYPLLQSWQLVIHAGMAVLEYRVLAGKPWFEYGMTSSIGSGTPMRRKNDPAMVVLYMAQLSIWIYTCICHVWYFEKQKDYWVMFGHHLATIGLLLLSFHFNYVRHGAVVLWIHDVSDIPIDLLKMFNYLKLAGAKGLFLTEIAFASVLAAWGWWRLYVLPVNVIYSSVAPWVFLGRDRNYCAENLMSYHDPSGSLVAGDAAHITDLEIAGVCSSAGPAHFRNLVVVNGLLCALVLMHIYWYAMFLRMLGRMLNEEATTEVGEAEYEGGSDDD